ncbi:MAG: OmpA family protein [Bryobacteraceae bacterium]|jgi:outer membrane protein OmpA-like peptidoglycan-associated protein
MRLSSWKFDTSSSDNIGIKIVTAGKGDLYFKKDGGSTLHYWYLSEGISLGGSLLPVSVTGSTKDMWNTGSVYMTDTFSGSELDPDDLAGYCLIGDITATVAVGIAGGGIGKSGTAMYVGMTQEDLYAEVAGGILSFAAGTGVRKLLELLAQSNDIDLPRIFRENAKALVLFRGDAAGAASASISASVGFVTLPEDGAQLVAPIVDVPEQTLPGDQPEPKLRRNGRVAAPPIALPGDVLFDFDKSDLKPSAVSALQRAKAIIQRYADRPLLIAGFTDSIGSDEYNMWLSDRRAKAVMKWLTDQKIPNAMSARGYGRNEKYAVASNKTQAGRQQNRRVEITINESD